MLLDRSRSLVVAAWATLVSQVIIVGTGGLILSALCMAGTRTLHDAHKKTTVIA